MTGTEHEAAVTFRLILCGTDFSEPAARAVDFGASLARKTGGILLLTHVVEYPAVDLEPFDLTFDFDAYREDLVREATERLESVADECRVSGEAELSIETRVSQGISGRELVRLAEDEGADLVVLGTTGHSGLGRIVFGSTPEAVVPACPCPVLSIRKKVPAAGFRHVMVTTDFSTAATEAFPYAVAFARLWGARLTLVHVATVAPGDPYATEISEDGRRQLEEAGRQRLEGVELPDRQEPDSLEVVRALSAHDGILRAAETMGVDLLVMATHGRTGIRNVLLGGTTASVMRYANCCVLTVRCRQTED